MNSTSAATAATTGAGRMALVAALYTFAVLLIAGLVRITGSADRPLIQFLHGALAVGFLLIATALAACGLQRRQAPGFAGRDGLLRPLLLAAALSTAMAALDALAARLELPPHVQASQYLLGLPLLAALLATTVRAGILGGGHTSIGNAADARRARRMALGTAAFGLVVIAFGAITAVTPAAPQACQGFPLCNGELLPRPDAPTHIHWTHRMLAFLLLLHVLGAFFATRKRAASAATLRAALAATTLVVLQILIAGALMGFHLAAPMQVLHLVAGTGLWVALACWASLARHDLRALELAQPRGNGAATQ